MSEPGRKWIVKDGEGKIYGPFGTSKILRQIEKGYFSGGEFIAAYPGGDWIPISASPEFYDKLLDVIASEGNGSGTASAKSEASASSFEDPVGYATDYEQASHLRRRRGRVVRETEEDENTDPAEPFGILPTPPPLSKTKLEEGTVVKKNGASTDDVIELTDLKALSNRERMRTMKLPLILIAAAIVLVLIAFLYQSEPAADRIRLLAPRRGQPELSAAEISEKVRVAVAGFNQDTFSGYMKAQDELVGVIEGSPRNLQAYGSLCLVYRELWQFTVQDTRDLNVVNRAMLEAKALERFGLLAGQCEVAYLFAAGRFREARSLIDSYLEIPDVNRRAPAFFELKADFLLDEGNFNEAAGYAEQARQIWPQWLKPYVTEARARVRQKNFPRARQLYGAVLSANPKHQVARIELALIEWNQFRQADKAFELLKAALDSDDRIPRPAAIDAHVAIAQIYEHRNQKSRALKHAKLALALNSHHPVARGLVVRLGGEAELKNQRRDGQEALYMGDQYVRSGDCFAAQAEYKAAFETDPSNATAAMKAAKCLWQLSQSTEAIEWLQKSIKADPKFTAAYTLLADYYSQRYDYLAAMRTLQRAQQMTPKSFEVYRGFAQVEIRRNNFSGALQFAERARDMYEADPETHILLAQALAGANKFVEAERSSLRAIELDETNVEAQSLYLRILVDLRGVESALETVNRLILDYPQIVEYRVAKGEILLKEERYANAAITAREVLSLEPRNKKAVILLGRSLAAQGSVHDALQAYLQAAEIDPSDANPLFLAGMLYAQENKYQDAARMFQRVLKSNARYPRAHYQLGLAFLRMNSLQEALQEAELERAINPELADAYILGAETFYAMNQFSNCAAEYQKAVARRPADSGMYVKMARCYRLSGALDSAMSLLKQAEKLESGNPDVWKELGATYHMRGMASEAVHAYTRYLALVPSAPDRAEVDAALKKIEAGDMSITEKGSE